MASSSEAAAPSRLPLWATGLTAAGLALGFTRTLYASPERAAQGQRTPAQFHADRTRAAAAPFEIAGRGWKDILLRVYLGLAQASALMLKIMRCA